MVNTLETILVSFVEFPLPPLEGNPTHSYLMEVNGYLNACSASVHSNLGNGAVGYLAITMQPAGFAIACPNAFITPTNLGATLILANPPPSIAIIGIQTRAHSEYLQIFNDYYNVKKACKKIIFALIPEAYYRSFKNKHTGFATVSCLNILTHLCTTCGTLQYYEVQENNEMMKQPITADTLFKDFIEQVEVTVDAVATQLPYMPEQIYSIAFTLV